MIDTGVETLIQRHRAYWSRQQVDRPLITLRPHKPLVHRDLPWALDSLPDGDIQLTPEMVRPERLVNVEQRTNEPGQLVLGGSFSVLGPYERIPWVEATLGCNVLADAVSGSIWSEPYLNDVREFKGATLGMDNHWQQVLLDFTKTLVERQDGSYLVTHTLMRGPVDLANAIVGDAAVCMAMFDDPSGLRDLLEQVSDVFLTLAKQQTALIPPFHGGYCNQHGIWAPGTVVRTQCDMSALLSPAAYAKHILPFDIKTCEPFDHSVIHLHSGYLHTVDALLGQELPHAIEIALDTGSTPVTTRDLVPVCRKILARKPVLIEGQMRLEDLDYLVEELPWPGLYIRADLSEAELEKARERYS